MPTESNVKIEFEILICISYFIISKTVHLSANIQLQLIVRALTTLISFHFLENQCKMGTGRRSGMLDPLDPLKKL